MDIEEAVRGRRAVRDYRQEALENSELLSLLQAAVWAPSGMNRQPWRFFVIGGRGTLARLSGRAKSHMLQEARHRPELAAVRGMLEQPDFNIFYNAPTLIVVCSAEPDEMAVKDCCLAAQTLMLTAFARGFGTCWIGFAESWLATADAKAELGIPSAFTVVAPIIIGRPVAPPPPTERRAPDVQFVDAREHP